MNTEKETQFKTKIVSDLHEKAYRDYANAAFDESRIPEVEKLITAAEGRLHGFEEEHSQLTADPEAHKREKRTRIKELEGKIEEEHEYIRNVRKSIEMIQKSIHDQRTKASAAMLRASWIEENYTFQAVDPESQVKEAATA